MSLSKKQLFIVVVIAAALIVAPASNLVSQAQAFPGGHWPITICHKGNDLTIDIRALPMHLILHGDFIGTCTVD